MKDFIKNGFIVVFEFLCIGRLIRSGYDVMKILLQKNTESSRVTELEYFLGFYIALTIRKSVPVVFYVWNMATFMFS